LTETPATPTLEDDLLKFAPVDYGHVACGVGATGNSGIDFTECDAVRELNYGGETRATRALYVIRRCVRIKPATKCRLTRKVPIARMLDDSARRYFSENLAPQIALAYQRRHCGR
jgi:hypothetical protein